MSVLYVSDLDGTLLRSDQRTSDYTNRAINSLVDKGMLFSYATARSSVTSQKVTEGLIASFPIIVYNGAFIKDNATGELLLKNLFRKSDAVGMVEELTANGITPIVYAFIDGQERFSYHAKITPAAREFVESRQDSRVRVVESDEELTEGEMFYITCIDDAEKLKPFYEKYKDSCHCVFQRDIYSGEQWLEIMPAAASKANAVKQLAKLLECDRIVVFGDGVNDIDMFEIADESYATQNAVPELKRIATGVIAANDCDGVARWLLERYNHQ